MLNLIINKGNQYNNLEMKGAVAIVSDDMMKEKYLITRNESNIYLRHPNMPDMAIVVFGRNRDHHFGMMIDRCITTDDGLEVDVPMTLSQRRFCLKMGQSCGGWFSNRGFLVNNTGDTELWGKQQLRLEEAIMAIKMYGCICPLRAAGTEDCENQIHHQGYCFDCRINNLCWLSGDQHKQLHDETGHGNHQRIITIHPDYPVPPFA